jgi:hypothetical protein
MKMFANGVCDDGKIQTLKGQNMSRMRIISIDQIRQK